MNRIFRIKEIDGNTDFQNVTLQVVKKSQYRVVLMGGADFHNDGTYGTNKTLGEYIETIATSKKYNIPLQKGDIQIINSPLFSEEVNGKDIYNELLKIITKDFDIKNGILILYGYSWGGQLLMEFLDDFQKSKIKINLLITIDAAKGPVSFSVNNDITSNVKRNLNIYQTHLSPIGSYGGYNEGNSEIKNIDLSKEKNSKGEPIVHSNIDEYTLLFIAQVIVYALKGVYTFSSLSDVDIKKAIKTYSSNGY